MAGRCSLEANSRSPRLFAEVANGQSHGLALPSASLIGLRSYFWVQIIKLTDHLSNYSQGIWLLFYAFGEQTERHSQESRGCILRMLVSQREHHRQESVPTRHALDDSHAKIWLQDQPTPTVNFLWIAMRPRDTVCSRAQREGRHRKNKTKSNSVDA